MKQLIKDIYWFFIKNLPLLRPIYLTRKSQTPIPFASLLAFRFGIRKIYWPTHSTSVIVDFNRIIIGIETSPGLMPCCYIQGTNGIEIGDYTQIASNVSIISANHALTDNRNHVYCSPVRIGSHSWIGTHATILPGVQLGPYTIVGAGAVVTKSFNSGYQVLAGNPAKIIKTLNPLDCILHRSKEEYCGFIHISDFETFCTRKLEQIK